MSVERDVLKAYNQLKAKANPNEPFPILTIPRSGASLIPATVSESGNDPDWSVYAVPSVTMSSGNLPYGYGGYNDSDDVFVLGNESPAGWLAVANTAAGNISVTPGDTKPAGLYAVIIHTGTHSFAGYFRLP